MCRLAYVILGDASLAEEVVMEAMLKTFSGWKRIRDVDHSDAYLKRTVVNLCRSRIRRKVVERKASVVLESRARLQPPQWDPERHESRRLVWEAIRALPERQRACTVLRYLEDMSEAQIADVLECSIGTVKSQLSKARSKLAGTLGASMGGES
jgi:RNA polymerase sigma-70 factor (sigma-E family)